MFLAPASVLSAADAPADSQAGGPGMDRTWTASLQAGFANTFQLTLGGNFGDGFDFQNRATASLNNAFREGDSLAIFGWSTTDLPSRTPNWQAGITYKARVLRKARRTLVVGGGIQRWLLPSVKTGAQDWLAAGTLTYTTSVGRVPIVVTQDSWSLLRSTLPTGSALYTQIYSQHTLLRREGFRLLLRQGPAHTYSRGFYGAQGNRVLRYSGGVVLAWKNTTLEAGCRQQFGLQDGIRNNRFWTLLLTRQITGFFRNFRN